MVRVTDPEQDRIMPSSTQVTANIDRSLGTFLSEVEPDDW